MIEALLAGFQASLLWLCVVALMSICGVVIAVNVHRQMKIVRRKLKGSAVAAVVVVALACILYGGRKGTVTVSDPYIVNSGSYLTNDVAHISIAKRTPILPDDTEILVYARQVDSTNAADWVRLEPHLTFADHPHDYSLPNATNHDVMVAANYVPAPTVHTNGVWQMKGFTIPGTGKAAFPNTRTIKKETP